MLRRLFWIALAVLGLLVLAVAVNTLRHGSRQLDVPPAPPLAVDENAAAARLSEAIRARTVCEAGLTVDHRVADGADAARAFATMQEILDDPFLLLG